jgi:DNA invertase Pin-like site-specific DNA recombinase
MQRLLERVRARRVDVILIYKIDRLTRSLADFAKLAEEFDKYGVSFVSVTQQFNTTTSMGRLMLNVLLSFAQFEREIAGERIRDKIAASKKKGMWMGGSIPLGYDWKDRTLVINQAEAKTVVTLYRLYLKHGNVRTVVSEASRLGLKTKVRLTSAGKPAGGKLFCRGHVYALLRNPIYIGRIPHRGETYTATHRGIVSEKDWQEVQKRLNHNHHPREKRTGTKATESLLTGLLFDSEGNRFTPSHSIKNGRRYRYYVEQPLTTGEHPAQSKLRRIPAAEIENVVRNGIADFLGDPTQVMKALGADSNTAAAKLAITHGRDLAGRLRTSPHAAMSLVRPLLHRIIIGEDSTRIRPSVQALRSCLSITTSGPAPPIEIVVPIRVGSRGGRMKFVVGNVTASEVDLPLLKALAQAHGWLGQIMDGTVRSIKQLAARERKAASYIGRVLRLALIAPDIQEQIITGQHPPELTATRLILGDRLPVAWEDQRRQLGVSA